MFAYLRYFSIISFILVLIAAVFVGMYFRSIAINGMIRTTIEKNNVNMAQFFIKSTWQQHTPLLDSLSYIPVSEWRNNPQFVTFAKDIVRASRAMPEAVVKVSFYTSYGEKFLSNTAYDVTQHRRPMWDKFFLNTDTSQNGLSLAQGGKTFTEILPSADYKTATKHVSGGSVIHSFIPIMASDNSNQIKGIMEMFYDIDEQWNYIFRFQLLCTIGIVSIFAVLYAALFYTSRRAERIIEKQHEANLELTEAKTRAEAENQEKSQFLANISHELRTPLNAIIGFSEIIKNESLGALTVPQYKEYIHDIHNSGTHLLSLITDILDFSKAEASKLQMDAVDVDVTKVIQSSLRFVAPRAEEARVQLVEQLPREHLIISADPKRLKQVILNLLSNSVKFTQENGSITVSAWVEEETKRLMIRVADTGIGIAAKDISKALATFGQVDSTLSRRYEGTGLGLPLTKKLVELMSGTFEIQSEVGLGTTITLSFPYITQGTFETADASLSTPL